MPIPHTDLITVAGTVTVSRELLEQNPPAITDYICGTLNGTIPCPPPKVEPVATYPLTAVTMGLAPGEAELIGSSRCLCGHLAALHDSDGDWRGWCPLCDCTELR